MVGECLSLWKEFINGHMLMICKGARSGVSQSTLHNNLSTGLTSYPQAMQGQGVGGGVVLPRQKTEPPCLKFG